MQKQRTEKILADTAYVRTGGSAEEQNTPLILAPLAKNWALKPKQSPLRCRCIK